MDNDQLSISIGILTVSDTCCHQKSLDRSGPIAIRIIQEVGYTVPLYDCISDDSDIIHSTVMKWIELKQVDAILTLGGTGISQRDVTSDTLFNIISKERRLSGLEHALYTCSFKQTEMASLSRFVAGIRDDTILVTLPGSTRAVEPCLTVILPILKHAVALLKNCQGLIRKEHKYSYNDLLDSGEEANYAQPRLSSIVTRPRQSEYPMISVDEALDKIFQISDSLLTSHEMEAVHYTHALGRVLGVDLKTQQSIPPFDASIMDGYAIQFDNNVGQYHVLGSICAGDYGFDSGPMQVANGTKCCVRVNTGGPIPQGANCVVPVEHTKLISTKPVDNNNNNNNGEEEEEEDVIEIFKTPEKRGQFIRLQGSDLNAAHVFNRGLIIGQTELGLLAGAGLLAPWYHFDDYILEPNQAQPLAHIFTLLNRGGYLPCLKQYKIGIFSTGNELTEATIQSNSKYCTRDTNRLVITSILRSHGYSNIVDFGIVSDSYSVLQQTIRKAIQSCDILITTGGVSMGERDLVTCVLRDCFHATVHFGRVCMKPGKPTTFVSVPKSVICPQEDHRSSSTIPVFCLPGNPVSAYVTTHLFVLPLLRKLDLRPSDRCTFPQIRVRLLHSVRLSDRPDYRRAQLVWSGDNADDPNSESIPCARCDHVGSQMSSRLASCLDSNLLVLLPPIMGGGEQLEELALHSIVPALVIGHLY